MVTCPQCRERIDGINHLSYGVGWCRQDIHLACLPLHVRVCGACRVHNEEYLSHQTPTIPQRKRT